MRVDSEPRQSFEKGARTYDLMVRAYEDCGYGVVEIP
jgi:predicted ATPase